MRPLSSDTDPNTKSTEVYWMYRDVLLWKELYVCVRGVFGPEVEYGAKLGQTADWNRYHKGVCKKLPQFLASEDYRRLDSYGRADAILLLNLTQSIPASKYERLRNIITSRKIDTADHELTDAEIFLSLLPLSRNESKESLKSSPSIPNEIHNRFQNNNFLIHSHLNPPFAHGAFSLASRTLNHSCTPNAVPKFVFSEGKLPRIDIVAICEIAVMEEACVVTLYSGTSVQIYADNNNPYRRSPCHIMILQYL
jgi:hypothetical protein